ncbi:MAG: sigma-70 family RNA polymerase sigma factor [Anaerolineae bacterium]|nr:sigma-70 family RNA polymerase sigma factor [Anaerolineae bacterium]
METPLETANLNDEQALVAALRAGDDAAFSTLVERYQASMVRIAGIYVADDDAAEEVTQETWLALLRGLDRFEGRSSLKTWLFTILTNRAKTRAARDGRSVRLELDESPEEPAVPSWRFHSADSSGTMGHWTAAGAPQSWKQPEEHLLAAETRALIDAAIQRLPPNQRTVISLRDIEGFSSDDVCNMLSISETNQRVLLHRARSRVRQALESYIREH